MIMQFTACARPFGMSRRPVESYADEVMREPTFSHRCSTGTISTVSAKRSDCVSVERSESRSDAGSFDRHAARALDEEEFEGACLRRVGTEGFGAHADHAVAQPALQ